MNPKPRRCPGLFVCVQSMNDSLDVEVLSVQPDGDEGLAKRKGIIARWRLKEARSKAAPRSMKMMGWTAPALRHQRCHNLIVAKRHNERSHPPCRLPRSGWILRSAFFRSARRQLRPRDCGSKEIAAVRVAAVLREACAVLDRHRGVRGARELTALGHGVRLVPPSYVKGYVKRG
jgi:hypothetical protein